MVIQTNVLALNSHRNLRVIGGKQFNASAKLSSGYKINSAADDASGLAISEKMRAQIRGLDMASKNAQDGISLIQTAEGGLQEVDNMVQRIRELVVQAANDTNDFDTADRKKLQEEIDQLTAGLDQMGAQVEFNAKRLLNGGLMDAATKGSLLADLSVKYQNLMGKAVNVAITDLVALAALLGNDGELGVLSAEVCNNKIAGLALDISYSVYITTGGVNANFMMCASANSFCAQGNSYEIDDFEADYISSADDLSAYIGAIDDYIGKLQDAKKNDAAGVDDILANLAYARQAALDMYAGLELALAMTKSYKALSDVVTSSGLWFQTGANSMQGMTVGIGKISSDILGIGKGNGIGTIKVDKPNALEVSAQIGIVENALQYVTAQRAKLGAVQNRLEFTKSSLEITSENLSASESRIRDTDMGKEMMKLTAANILQQAGISMLAQANQSPQSVLQLLR